jgi:hypothetical protein
MRHEAISELFQRSGFEGRRMGRRVSPEGLWVSWEPVRTGRGRRRHKGAARSYALVFDVSISGARVEVGSGELLTVGSMVTIGLEGNHGDVRIRRAVLEQDGRTIYGVEFVYLDERLRRCLESMVHGED